MSEEVLRQLLQLPTVAGMPVTAAIAYIRSVLEEQGLPCEVYGQKPGYENLIVRLGGGAAVGLHAHIDTCGVEPSQAWYEEPFAGQSRNGYLIGRGALDCKGLAAVFVSLLIRLSKRSRPPDLTLMITCDEETGGELGTKWLLEQGYLPNFSVVIGEGGGALLGNGQYRLCQTAERGLVKYLLHAFCEREAFYCLPVNQAAVYTKGCYDAATTNYMFCSHQGSSLDKNCFFVDRIAVKPKGEEAEVSVYYSVENPCLAELVAEQLGTSPSQLEEILHIPPTYSRTDTKAYLAIKRSCSAELLPYMSSGFSDNRYFRSRQIPCYGFFPLSVQDYPQLIHQPNEMIYLPTLQSAEHIYEKLLNEIEKG